jgi:two-component system, LytTR family, response regulator LytT
MNVIIVEDDPLACHLLTGLLEASEPELTIPAPISSVAQASAWLRDNPPPDLIFMDIHLADGECFRIFEQVELQSPVIFTTAHPEYALDAFKVNSIGYLLKPVQPEDLAQVLAKFRLLYTRYAPQNCLDRVARSLEKLNRQYKTRFLVKFGQHLQYKSTDEVAYFYAEGKTVYLVTHTNRRYVVEYTLEELEEVLDPNVFFRPNRKYIVRIESVKDIQVHPNSRLKIFLNPAVSSGIIVSRERVPQFKEWIDN